MAKNLLWAIIGVVSFSTATNAAEESPRLSSAPPPSNVEGGVPLDKVIDSFAEATRKRVVVDSRVRGYVITENVNTSRPSLAELQSILAVYGFVAVDVGGILNIVPDANMRTLPLPVVAPTATGIGDDEIVISVLAAKKLTVVQLVPILRPLLPQSAHLAANPQSNQLIVAGRFGNVKTMVAILKELEKNATATPVAESLEKQKD